MWVNASRQIECLTAHGIVPAALSYACAQAEDNDLSLSLSLSLSPSLFDTL